jgi:hypothetical protein
MRIIKNDIKMPPGVTGVRRLNDIMLERDAFDIFIMALAQDNFVVIRDLFSRVVDAQTRELCYPEEKVKEIRPSLLLENGEDNSADNRYF